MSKERQRIANILDIAEFPWSSKNLAVGNEVLSGLPGLMAPQPTGDGLAAERMFFRRWKWNERMRIVAVEGRKSFATIEEKTLPHNI